MAKKQSEFQFESALKELDTLVAKMEEGELSLENSLQSFERGVGLIRQCQQALTEAEQKVKILTEQQGELKLAEFHQDEEDNDS